MNKKNPLKALGYVFLVYFLFRLGILIAMTKPLLEELSWVSLAIGYLIGALAVVIALLMVIGTWWSLFAMAGIILVDIIIRFVNYLILGGDPSGILIAVVFLLIIWTKYKSIYVKKKEVKPETKAV